MRLLIAAIALSVTGTSSALPQPARTGEMPVIDPSPDAAGNCPPISRFHAQRQGGTPAPKKLNELPSADTYATVYRRIGGCEVPVIVRYGVQEQPRSR